MHATQFDTISKTLARRFGRRRALGHLGGGALALAAGVGTMRSRAAAQDAEESGEATVCISPFQATVYHGPSAGETLVGMLVLRVETDGRVDTGALVRADQAPLWVVGQATGRAVNLLFDDGAGNILYGVGVAENDLRECTGALGGPLVGPEPGDAGDWDFCCCPTQFNQCRNAGDQSMCDSCGDDVIPILPVDTEACVLNCPPGFTASQDTCFLDCVSF